MTDEPLKLQPSRGVRLAENGQGRSVAMSGRRKWRHPWWTTPQWLPKKQAWSAFVLAGFCNGVAPLVRTTAGDLREAKGTFFGQLVDARTGAAEIAQLARLALEDFSGLPDDAQVDVPLYENPPVGLNAWKNIGFDGGGVVPAFFLARGVNKAPRGGVAALEGGAIPLASTTPPKGNRLLRSCDIILHQPRVALTSNIATTVDLLVVQELGQREARAGDSLRILSGDFDERAQENNKSQPGTNIVANNFEEANFDEVLIATVYLLSPPDLAPLSQPDGKWQAFVKHNLFWNVSWEQPQLTQIATNFAITGAIASLKFLGSGAGAFAVQYLAASLDEAFNAAINRMKGTTLAGTFWTPTGGGTTSAVPVTIPEPPKTGLDKGAKAEAKAKAAKAAMRNLQLDPPFPFEGLKFNRSLLAK